MALRRGTREGCLEPSFSPEEQLGARHTPQLESDRRQPLCVLEGFLRILGRELPGRLTESQRLGQDVTVALTHGFQVEGSEQMRKTFRV